MCRTTTAALVTAKRYHNEEMNERNYKKRFWWGGERQNVHDFRHPFIIRLFIISRNSQITFCAFYAVVDDFREVIATFASTTQREPSSCRQKNEQSNRLELWLELHFSFVRRLLFWREMEWRRMAHAKAFRFASVLGLMKSMESMAPFVLVWYSWCACFY